VRGGQCVAVGAVALGHADAEKARQIAQALLPAIEALTTREDRVRSARMPRQGER
jgi:hypothetical protein